MPPRPPRILIQLLRIPYLLDEFLLFFIREASGNIWKMSVHLVLDMDLLQYPQPSRSKASTWEPVLRKRNTLDNSWESLASLVTFLEINGGENALPAGSDQRKRDWLLLLGLPPGPSQGGSSFPPGLLQNRLAAVRAWLLVTFQSWLAAGCPLPGSSKLQETNKMSPMNGWLCSNIELTDLFLLII